MQQYESKADRNLTPLHVAAQCNNTEVSQLLVQRNGDIEAKSKLNSTPLQVVAQRKSTEVALLLQHNADIKAMDKYNRTSLHLALLKKRKKLVQFPLQLNIDIEVWISALKQVFITLL